ncbi:hypothetical protein [Halobacteriovorax sp. JY17]|uniref:hypothetical protein n=1 Tax=Halobacteriovorax sp. JY17 TaxID=2014617 RepID=UPI000C3F96DE|nr:hypothetical protein [Halobacteriovorax sp. JY17]PIK15643.1 MAG: hypothetical protein CES88_02645 [Halobacteriovorax sp. JY17]
MDLKINRLNSIKSFDTSAGRGNDIVEGLESISYSLQKLEGLTEKIATPQNKDPSSPYATDRPHYDATRIKGTEKETQWKKVANSREQQLKEITSEDNNEIAANHNLAKSLNII